MTTLHLSKDDIAAMVTDDEGNVTIGLTDAGAHALEAAAATRVERRERNIVRGVQMTVSPAPPPDAGFAAGYRQGYATGRGPGMPPLRA
ncbi:hypothetical protein [Streptomyces turgidiscabies]|uniref:hypothetical protein n=1 Tax=Streptomyces turgidiscabies TaxID=85558 RepID=UPI0038F735FD